MRKDNRIDSTNSWTGRLLLISYSLGPPFPSVKRLVSVKVREKNTIGKIIATHQWLGRNWYFHVLRAEQSWTRELRGMGIPSDTSKSSILDSAFLGFPSPVLPTCVLFCSPPTYTVRHIQTLQYSPQPILTLAQDRPLGDWIPVEDWVDTGISKAPCMREKGEFMVRDGQSVLHPLHVLLKVPPPYTQIPNLYGPPSLS